MLVSMLSAINTQASPAERTFDPLPPHTTREGSMDRATSLLRQAPFDRPTVLMLCLALEDAWLSVRPEFADRKGENAGRMNVADGILALARAGQRDPQVSPRLSRAARGHSPVTHH